MTDTELKKFALDIVNACRKGDSAEMIAEKKIIPMLKTLMPQTSGTVKKETKIKP